MKKIAINDQLHEKLAVENFDAFCCSLNQGKYL